MTHQYLSNLERYIYEKSFYLTQHQGQEHVEFTKLGCSTDSDICPHFARGQETEFTLETHSFALERAPSGI